jgi:hypothetical protein
VAASSGWILQKSYKIEGRKRNSLKSYKIEGRKRNSRWLQTSNLTPARQLSLEWSVE